MAKRKSGRGGCQLEVAIEVFGGTEALRREADHRATWSLWKTQKTVPWAVVGPVLLKRWREASEGRGLVPQTSVAAWKEADSRRRRALQEVLEAAIEAEKEVIRRLIKNAPGYRRGDGGPLSRRGL
jgi:hypothetical protein